MTPHNWLLAALLAACLAACSEPPAPAQSSGPADATAAGGDTLAAPDNTADAATVPASKWAEVSVGYAHACGVTGAGRVACWGANFEGQLGDGTTASRLEPAFVAGLSDIASVTADWHTTCAIAKSGQVWCWGQAISTAAGVASYLPVAIAVAKPVVQFAMSYNLACARYVDGTVGCLGIGFPLKLEFFPKAGITGARQIDADWDHRLCWLGADDRISCFGVPTGPATQVSSKTLMAYVGSWNAGFVGLDSGGQAWLRGSHQLFPPPMGCTAERCEELTPLPGASAMVAIAADCGRRADGTVLCWNAVPATAAGNKFPLQSGAVEVAGLAGSKEVLGSGALSCVLSPAGDLRCWGTWYAMGAWQQWTPGVVNGLADAKSVFGGVGGYCALDSLGKPWCWGQAPSEWPGIGNGDTDVAALYSGLPGVKIGDVHIRSICGVDGKGMVKCRGESEFLFGKGMNHADCLTGPCSLPEAGTGVTAVYAGPADRWCSIDGQGVLRCWGDNADHAADFGTGLPTDLPLWPPKAAASMPPAVSGCNGENFGCAVVAGGKVWCWGMSSLWLEKSSHPQQVPGISGAKSVHCSFDGACAVTQSGTVSCWGTRTQKGVPEPSGPYAVEGLPPVTALATGGGGKHQHTCAIASGGVWCFGAGDDGQLGISQAITVAAQPQKVAGISQAVSIAAGWGHTCVALQDGGLRCWGTAHAGEFGNEPVPISNATLVAVPAE